jgi:hypothetical protein
MEGHGAAGSRKTSAWKRTWKRHDPFLLLLPSTEADSSALFHGFSQHPRVRLLLRLHRRLLRLLLRLLRLLLFLPSAKNNNVKKMRLFLKEIITHFTVNFRLFLDFDFLLMRCLFFVFFVFCFCFCFSFFVCILFYAPKFYFLLVCFFRFFTLSVFGYFFVFLFWGKITPKKNAQQNYKLMRNSSIDTESINYEFD